MYIATAEANDEEMRERILVHQQSRKLSQVALSDVVLLDCITLLASNLLLTLPEDCTQSQANDVVLTEIDALLALQQKQPAIWIVVSNEVGMGIVPPYRLGRLYRDALGAANQRLAQAADEVILMVAGLPWHLKDR